MARFVLILLSASIAFAGCSCDDDDPPAPNLDGGNDSGMPDGSMDSSTDSGNDSSTATDSSTTDGATADAMPDAPSDNDAGYDAGPGPRNACGGEMCDLLSADSCTTVGDGCQFLLPPDPDPSPIPFAQCQDVGTVPEGGDCTSPTDCAPGLDCTADGSAGKCRSYCCNLNQKSECPGEQACVIELTDLNDDPTGVGLCDDCDACDPLNSAGTCNGTSGCYPIPGSDGRTFSDCTLCLPSTMGLTAGERCRSVNDCAPGLGCFRLNNRAPVCVQMCDLEAASDPCTGAPTCQDRLGAASQSGTVGVCIQ